MTSAKKIRIFDNLIGRLEILQWMIRLMCVKSWRRCTSNHSEHRCLAYICSFKIIWFSQLNFLWQYNWDFLIGWLRKIELIILGRFPTDSSIPGGSGKPPEKCPLLSSFRMFLSCHQVISALTRRHLTCCPGDTLYPDIWEFLLLVMGNLFWMWFLF